MAAHHHPHILILFLGGSALDDRGRRGSVVLQSADVEGWLQQLGEMEVIASTDGVFVHNGLAAVGLGDWAKAATLIKDRYAKYDGFVVVHQTATIPSAAVALSLMLENLGKPVVLVSSPLLSPTETKAGWAPVLMPDVSRLGAKANFINALQVAVSDLGEVVVAIGHQLYRGRTFVGSLATPRADLIGKIDFGVRFFGQVRKRQSAGLRLKASYATKVAMIEFLPGLDLLYVARLAAGSQGIFLSVVNGLSVPADVIMALSKISNHPPLVLNGELAGSSARHNIIVMAGDRNNVLIRFLWALGQSKQPAMLRKLMMT